MAATSLLRRPLQRIAPPISRHRIGLKNTTALKALAVVKGHLTLTVVAVGETRVEALLAVVAAPSVIVETARLPPREADIVALHIDTRIRNARPLFGS